MICALWIMVGVASFALGYTFGVALGCYIDHNEWGEN